MQISEFSYRHLSSQGSKSSVFPGWGFYQNKAWMMHKFGIYMIYVYLSSNKHLYWLNHVSHSKALTWFNHVYMKAQEFEWESSWRTHSACKWGPRIKHGWFMLSSYSTCQFIYTSSTHLSWLNHVSHCQSFVPLLSGWRIKNLVEWAADTLTLHA